ncbi:MFS transporter, partial [Sphingobium sp. Z007]
MAVATIEGSSSSPAGSGGMLDDIPMSSYQIWSVLMIAATVILDGLDNQMLGLAAPSLLKEWGIDRTALGSVFALGFVGMAIGTLTSGWVGDRFGRRGALIA